MSLFLFLVVIFLIVGIFSIEAWPFSAYPMFSTSFNTSFSSFLYLEMESETGEKQKWKPKKAFLQKQMDNYLKSILFDKKKNTIDTAAINSERTTKVVAHFYKLYCTEQENVESIHKISLIHQSFSIRDRYSKQLLLKAFKIEDLLQSTPSL